VNFPPLIVRAAALARDLDVHSCGPLAALGDRQRRIEIRTALADLMGVMVEFADQRTSALGWRDSAGWHGRGIKDLAGEDKHGRPCGRGGARLGFRRCQRVLSLLAPGHWRADGKKWIPGAGMIRCRQIRDKGDVVNGVFVPNPKGRSWRSRNGLWTLTAVFWRALGLELAWSIAQKKAKEKPETTLAPDLKESDRLAAVQTHLTAKMRPWTARGLRAGSAPAPAPGGTSELMEIFNALKLENPTMGDGDLAWRAELVQRGRGTT